MANPGSTADETEIPDARRRDDAGQVQHRASCSARAGMGAVYEATHTEISKRVAIKVLNPALAADAAARARASCARRS